MAAAKKQNKESLNARILSCFFKNPTVGYNYKQISNILGIKDKPGKERLRLELEKMLSGNDLREAKRGKFILNQGKYPPRMPSRNYISGVVDMKPTGKAYVITDEPGSDIFIAPYNTFRALDGDRVKVLLMPRRQGKKPEGQIVEIINRAREEFVGVIQKTRYYSYLIPDNASVPVDIYIPNDRVMNASDGDKVVVKITEWPENSKNPFGEVIFVLGKPGSRQVEMQSILAEFGFPLSFPEFVEKEASKIGTRIPDSEISLRRDFRDVFTLTIDPEDAKDFDDAVSLKKAGDHNWEVGIHIADVSHYVRENSAIDQEAYKRGTSVYLADRVIPMLPEVLSNQVCSLNPNEDKLCFSAVFIIDPQGNILEEWFGKTVINSRHRFNYEQVQEVIDNKEGPCAFEILTLHRLAECLRNKRFEKGSIAFDTEEVRFRLDENGKPVEVFIKQQKESNKLIEDFMLLANRRVAEKIGKAPKGIQPRPFVYRVHDKPVAEKLDTFTRFIGKMGYKIDSRSNRSLARSFNDLFSSVKGRGEENMINQLAIRTMARAVYSTENIGHYGLAFAYYTHFTSPIRRYPDLMVHRLLQRYLSQGKPADKDELEKKCRHSTDMERKATDAERASVKYMQAVYLSDHIGKVFTGHVSGVSKWGIYVEIIENKCEGMVSIRDMSDDVYYIDEENYTAIGQFSGKKYRIGDIVKIKVKKINLIKKQIDFDFAG